MSENEVMDPATAAYRDHVMSGLKGMSEAASAINKSVEARIRTVPESFFVNTLIPIMRKWVMGQDSPDVAIWMNIADGINNPINVADDNGNVVAILPPPFIPTPTLDQPPTGRRFTTVHHIVQRQSDSMINGDIRTVMEIENELISIFSPQAGDEAKADSLLKLAKIYRRYELPMEELFGDSAQDISKKLEALENAEGVTQPTVDEVGEKDDSAEERFIY